MAVKAFTAIILGLIIGILGSIYFYLSNRSWRWEAPIIAAQSGLWVLLMTYRPHKSFVLNFRVLSEDIDLISGLTEAIAQLVEMLLGTNQSRGYLIWGDLQIVFQRIGMDGVALLLHETHAWRLAEYYLDSFLAFVGF